VNEISTYVNTFEEFKTDANSTRIADIRVIRDLREGNSFIHFEKRFINFEKAKVSVEDMKKQFHSMNDMDTVINKLVSYCPSLNTFVPAQPLKAGNKARAKKQQALVKKALKLIRWDKKLSVIYDDQESKGDSFYHVYFDKKYPNIPLLKYLNPEYVTDIILDRNGEPDAIIYREQVIGMELGANLTPLQTNPREVIWVFKKGETLIYDPLRELTDKKQIKYIKDEYGNQLYNVERKKNRESYADKIAVLRFASFLRDGEEFSRISASNYIEHCLTLDKINSNIQNINMMLGHPTLHLLDCTLLKGERKAGGVFYYKSDEGKEGKIIDVQIKNDLKSWFDSREQWLDALYDKVGLVNKSVELKLGSSDSSRVLKQLNSPMENKIEIYVDNTLEEFATYIEILFKENDLWNEEIDFGITLKRPDFIVKNSEFDQQLYQSNEVNRGAKTKDEIALENDDSYDDIDARNQATEEEEAEVEISNETTDAVRTNNNI
jgi:hypothetical protein